MIKSFVKRLSLLTIFTALVFFFLPVVHKDHEDKFRIRSTFLDLTPDLNKKVKIHGQFSSEVFFIDDVKPGQ